jgi:protein arginine kinase activator
MPKKCSRCAKSATLHITELRDGVVKEIHLCESCAHDYLTNSEAQGQTESEKFSDKLAALTSDSDLEQLDQLVCPNCQITFREFRSQGRLGCWHDYIAFERELNPLLENIHGETQHTGKFPKRGAPDASQRQYQMIKLHSDLRAAVDEERYEDAARLRDQIQKLETELATDESRPK